MSGTEPTSDREEDDYRFLHSMLMEKKLHLLFKIHEQLRRFEKRSPVHVQEHAASLASDLAEELLFQGTSDEARELSALISKPNFKSLLHVHDAVAQRDFEPTLPPIPDNAVEKEEDSVKIISLVKTKEPLGATIKMDKSTGAIVVARIMRGGSADKSGLIHEGDELKEVNGVSLKHRKPKEILPLLACSQGEVKLKVIPGSSKEDMPLNITKLFVRALFDYDPVDDPTVPCKDAAVAFRRGDVLHVVSTEDDTWWQACHLGDASPRAGLVPSKQLQERRVSLQRPKALFKPRLFKPSESPVTEDVDYGAISGIHIAGLRRSFRLGRKGSVATKDVRFRRWSAEALSMINIPTYTEVIPYQKESKDRHRLVVLKIKYVYSFDFKPYVVFVKPPRIEELRLTRRRAKFLCGKENANQVRIFSTEC
ncbi:MAGUK p55 subfamily member 7-like [Nematolebias whitei]|uniref:MAGUK p55 subfamily member 7-like n=1 Tax=Nematolebias whitei TaxID=451745 RepID=UPI001897977A|nr:MAGUK p55 subfamily member 7-like [Nematolebias whitei]